MRHILPGALAACAVMSGCVEDDGSIFIQGALPIAADADCEVDPKGTELLPAGLFDVLNPTRGYQVALKVRTNLPSTFTNVDVTQSRTISPNYPAYGSTDNNVIFFESASIGFSFVTTPETAAAVADNFTCDPETNRCERDGLSPLVSGSVFNLNTALSTEAAVFLEAISATEAALFAATFADTLATPEARQRVVAEIRVKGSTTGNGDLRPISSFPFPMAIDLCRGCLAPTDDFCGSLPSAAGVVGRSRPVGEGVCSEGQDERSAQCVCFARAGDGTETEIGPARNGSCR
jgi:hypothetical protein